MESGRDPLKWRKGKKEVPSSFHKPWAQCGRLLGFTPQEFSLSCHLVSGLLLHRTILRPHPNISSPKNSCVWPHWAGPNLEMWSCKPQVHGYSHKTCPCPEANRPGAISKPALLGDAALEPMPLAGIAALSVVEDDVQRLCYSYPPRTKAHLSCVLGYISRRPFSVKNTI